MAPVPRYTSEVPDETTDRLREICLSLPDAYEDRAWGVVAPKKLVALVDRPDPDA